MVEPTRRIALETEFKKIGLSLLLRDESFVIGKDKVDRPLAFICHDSRDKDALVRPLASKLQSMLCPVWYDEFSLKPGDSLRESIEKGIKECEKIVVVLSKNFFENKGWSKREFDTIFTKEIFEKKRVMVPIWLNVNKEEVYEYSPILLDTVGLNAEIGVDELARKTMSVLNYVPPHIS